MLFRSYFYRLKVCAGTCTALSAADPGYRMGLPEDVQASDGSFPDRVEVTWTDVRGETGYQVYRCGTADVADCGIAITTTGANSSGYSDTGGAPGVTYYYRVKACNNEGCTELSEPDTGFVEALTPPPPAPGGVSATDGDFVDKVRISWIDVSGETSYQVFRCSGSSTGTCSQIATPAANATSYDDTGADASGTVHHYRLKACNANGCSDFSAEDTGYRDTGPLPDTKIGRAHV